MMKFIAKYRKRLLAITTALFAVVIALACSVGVKFDVRAAGATPHASVDFDYTYDFERAEKNAWQADAYEYENVRDGWSCLSPGSATSNPLDVTQSGYVEYKLNAKKSGESKEKVFSNLALDIKGRVFHLSANGEDCCYLRVFMRTEESAEWQLVQSVSAVTDGAWSAVPTIVFPEEIQEEEICFVRIELKGQGDDWVAIQKITFSGETHYKGVAPVGIDLGEGREEIASLNQSVTLRKPNLVTDRELTYTAKVFAPDGSEVTVENNSFLATAKGKYEVVYTVSADEGDYTNSYVVHVVDDAKASGYVGGANYAKRDRSNFNETSNYYAPVGTLSKNADEDVEMKGDVNAYYLLPLDFSGQNAFNLTFDINELPIGGSFEFAFYGKAGEIDFDKKSTAGIYFTFTNNFNQDTKKNELIVYAFFSDGATITTLYGLSYPEKVEGRHGVGFNRRTDRTEAIECYFDGMDFGSGQMYEMVKLSKIFKGSNTVYMGYRTVNSTASGALETEVELCALTKADKRAPVLVNSADNTTYKEYPSEMEVGKTFTLPSAAIMYDAVDGPIAFTVRVEDPYGNEVALPELGEKTFTVEYSGRYSVYYEASDYNGNGSGVAVIKPLTAKVQNGAPDFVFKKEIDASGRVGKTIKLPVPTVRIRSVQEVNGKTVEKWVNDDTNLIESAKVVIVTPLGSTIERKPGQTYTPFDMGVYKIRYEVSNAVASAQSYFEINIKANVDETLSYQDVFKEENWEIDTSDGKTTRSDVKSTKDGIQLSGGTYCSLPFEMSQGIQIKLDLRNLVEKGTGVGQADCWASLGIGSSKTHGGFASQAPGFVYFMFYLEGGVYKFYMNYYGLDGTKQSIDGGDLGASSIVSVAIEMKTGNTQLNDNINVYLNNKKRDVGGIDAYIKYSSLVDDENFCYLTTYSYGNATSFGSNDYKSLIIKEISMCDQQAPVFTFDGVDCTDYQFKSVAPGATVTIPQIGVSDDMDMSFRYTVGLYSPSGNLVDYSGGTFVAEELGTYALVLKAYDKSGNSTYLIKEIVVAEGSGCSSSLKLSATGGVVLVVVVATLCVLLPKRSKQRQKGGK